MLKHELNQLMFSDSGWGGSVEYKSVSGSLIYFHRTLGWRARKQKPMALSSTEAEYNALTESVQDLKWCKKLIYEATGMNCLEVLYCDSQSAISIASNPIYHHGTRHMNFRLHLIRQLVEDKTLLLKYIPTEKMLANSFTKNMPLSKNLSHLRKVFSLQELTSMGVCEN
ncbi:hypothetical protein O181_019517 [Austropuccinia psidii MF-1]|uniref:Retrovirus-related Pol polyprotein from transposon TNT 1-94 n=1 Tax=Austropuccinia psidii MF-1 TaxID=1389203 RepID=A0A9Q3GUH8_9BASI|nr:hypothetical protein [Austropuccinia psidii MF-1]